MNQKINDIFALFHHGHLNKAMEKLILLKKDCNDFDNETYYHYQSTLTYVATALKDTITAHEASDLYIEHAKKNQDMSHLHRAHHQKAMVYRDFGLYDKAEDHLHLEATIINQFLNSEPYLLSVNQCEFGTIFHFQNKYQESLKQFEFAEFNARGIDDPFLLPCIYRGIGIAQMSHDNTESLKYLSKARDMFIDLEEEKEANKINKLISSIS